MTPPGPPPPRLTGDGVVLRELVEADLGRMLEAVRDPLTAWATTVPVPYAARDAEAFLDGHVRPGWAANTSWTFAFGSAEDPGTYAGSIELSSTGLGRAEIGFLTHPDARGAGLTTAAVRTILSWGLGPMGLTSVEWRARVDNTASRRLAWRCGFRLGGTIREGMEQRGTRLDCHVATVLAGEPLEPAEPWQERPGERPPQP